MVDQLPPIPTESQIDSMFQHHITTERIWNAQKGQNNSCEKSFEELRATLDLMIKRHRWAMTLNTVLTAIVWFLIGYSLR